MKFLSFPPMSCDQDPVLEQEAANRSPVATNIRTNITHIVLWCSLYSQKHSILATFRLDWTRTSEKSQKQLLKGSGHQKNMDNESRWHSIAFQLNLPLKDPSSHPFLQQRGQGLGILRRTRISAHPVRRHPNGLEMESKSKEMLLWSMTCCTVSCRVGFADFSFHC